MNQTINILISTISILICVAFYTLIERKILSYSQIRKGPNKISLLGLLQPISDAIKLFNKNLSQSEISNMLIFFMSPSAFLIISILILSIIPFSNFSLFDNNFNILMFMLLSSLSVYIMLSVGWSSNSKYSHLGSIRSIAQMISYEISFFFIILFMIILSNSYNFLSMMLSQHYFMFLIGNLLLFFTWLISCLAEVNRSPFDFAEGESELVSGFNVEFMGGWFAMIFLSEYLMMIILSILSTIMFSGNISKPIPIMIILIITIVMIWIRTTLPRLRFDLLMNFNWKIILPLIILSISFPLVFNSMYY